MLQDLGWLKKVKIWDGTRQVTVSPEYELAVRPPCKRMFDQHFNGSSLNTLHWSDTLAGSASIIVDHSFCNMNVTTASGDSAEIVSLQSFVHIFSQLTSFKCGIVLEEHDLDNNTRIWGMRNSVTEDGWYFRLQNGVLQVCTEHHGVVHSTSVNQYKPTDGYVHRYDAQYRNYKVIFSIDQVEIHTDLATTDHLYDNEELNLYFRNYNTGVTSTSVALKLEGIALFDNTSSSTEISGIDDDGLIKKVAVTSTGRLKIDTAPADAPPATTAVARTEYSSVSGSDDDVFPIPNGEILIINRFVAGAEVDSTAGNVIELWYDPLGTGLSMEIIDMIFCSGDGDQHDLRATYVGDGTKQIRMRRRRFGGGSKEIFGRWEGYY